MHRHIATQTERSRYEHDALGRRTKKFESGVVTEYVYLGARLIAEYEDTGGGPTLARRYLHGVGLDELVALDSGGSRYFAFGDALGSVEALATGGGTVAEWYRYDAFGSATVMDGNEVVFPLNGHNLPQSPLNNALWFTGARHDGESGQYHMRARQYEPATGRFASRDPLGYVDSANAYLYAINDPVNWRDPMGLETQSGPWGQAAARGRREINTFVPAWLPGPGWVNAPVDVYRPPAMPAAPRALTPPPVPVPAPMGTGSKAFAIAKGVFLGIIEGPINSVRAGHDLVNEAIAWGAYGFGGTYTYSPWTSGAKLTQELMASGMAPGEAAVYGTFESANSAANATRSISGDVLTGELLGYAARTARRLIGKVDEAAGAIDEIGVSGCPVPSPLNVTEEGLEHVLQRHSFGGARSAGKSIFGEGEDIAALIRVAQSVTPVQQAGRMTFQRVVDAGRTIGVDRATGLATSIYSVITNAAGDLITAFPGVP